MHRRAAGVSLDVDGDVHNLAGFVRSCDGCSCPFVVANLVAGAPAGAFAQAQSVAAFVHVNVIPMDRERVLRDQTVLVKDGKIEAIGSELPVPAGAQAIDGHGTAFLSPGLADMHSHSETRNDLAVYLANGVTTVLQMGGAPFGQIAAGYRADLILTTDNPLSMLSTLRAPLGVMVNGHWRDATALKDLLSEVADNYRRASEPR